MKYLNIHHLLYLVMTMLAAMGFFTLFFIFQFVLWRSTNPQRLYFFKWYEIWDIYIIQKLQQVAYFCVLRIFLDSFIQKVQKFSLCILKCIGGCIQLFFNIHIDAAFSNLSIGIKKHFYQYSACEFFCLYGRKSSYYYLIWVTLNKGNLRIKVVMGYSYKTF